MDAKHVSTLPWFMQDYSATTVKIVDKEGKTVAYVHKGTADSALDNADFILKAVEAWTKA